MGVQAVAEGVWVGSQGCVGCMMSLGGSWGIISLVGFEMNGEAWRLPRASERLSGHVGDC